jgi:hypothetical protein
MATLIPSISTCKFDSSGEGRFARLIEAKLEDDYLCWYNVPIGPALLHPDFIILHPQRGAGKEGVASQHLTIVSRKRRGRVSTLDNCQKLSCDPFSCYGKKQ